MSQAERSVADEPDARPVVLHLSGDVDIASEGRWREQGDALLSDDPELRELTVDLAEVTFLDSRGMAMLVHLYTRLLERGGSLALQAVPRRVRKALLVAGLDQLFGLPEE